MTRHLAHLLHASKLSVAHEPLAGSHPYVCLTGRLPCLPNQQLWLQRLQLLVQMPFCDSWKVLVQCLLAVSTMPGGLSWLRECTGRGLRHTQECSPLRVAASNCWVQPVARAAAAVARKEAHSAHQWASLTGEHHKHGV